MRTPCAFSTGIDGKPVFTLGRYLEIDIADGIDPEEAKKRLQAVSERSDVYNSKIEDLRIEVVE